MHCVLVTVGFPSPGHHGGAITCFAIAKALRARGHRVTALGLLDTSPENPYRNAKADQLQALSNIGVEGIAVEYDAKRLRTPPLRGSAMRVLLRRITKVFYPDVEYLFEWTKLQSPIEAQLRDLRPDVIFCYHFDALSALYQTTIAPIVAGVGDLWHLPSYFRWKILPSSLTKYTTAWKSQWVFNMMSKKCMCEMLQRCRRYGAFAAHYAQWLRQQPGLEKALYFRTPVEDPAGASWPDLKKKFANTSSTARILIIGNLGGTVMRQGLLFFTKQVLPVFEKDFSGHQFEIHLVGGGRLDPEVDVLLRRPYVKRHGYVPDISQEMFSADIILEPTPITLGIRTRIVTAFSYGACVVTHAANTAGIPELKDGDNALIARNASEFSAAMVRALANFSLREQIGKKARATYEQYFSETTAAGEMVQLLKQVAQR